jgi:hypothetical protein
MNHTIRGFFPVRSAATAVAAIMFLALPLAVTVDAQRAQDTVLLGGKPVTSFEANLSLGELSHNTTTFLSLNASARVVSAMVGISGSFYAPMVNLSGRGAAVRDGEGYGQGQHGGGDYNSDGYGDFVIGADGTAPVIQGRVDVFYGSPTGIGRNANWSYAAGIAGGGFGYSITHGRYNNDSYDDLVVGEAHEAASGIETVYVFFGSATGASATPSLTLVINSTTRFHWGEALAGGLDLNNDSYDDLVVGEPQYGGSAGRIVVLWGGPGGLNVSNVTAYAPSGTTRYGIIVRSLGDTDGDGLDEFTVGAPNNNSNTGQVDVFEGVQGSQSLNLLWSKLGSAGEEFGYELAGGVNLTGDAYPDLAVSAPVNGSLIGAVYIFNGTGGGGYQSVAGTVLLPASATQEQFGAGLDIVGDIDGDSVPDVVVGANRYNNFDGRLYIYTHRNFTAAAARIVEINSTGLAESFGWVVKSAGDLNGDGVNEYGAFLAQGFNASFKPGSTRVYYGTAHPYPENVTIYVNRTAAWSRAGALSGSVTTADFSAFIQAYVTAHRSEANASGLLLVPLSFNISYGGLLNVSLIQVMYSIVSPPNAVVTAPSTGGQLTVSWNLQATDANVFSIWSNKSGSWGIIGNVSYPRTFFNDTNVTDGVRYFYYMTEWDTSVPLQSAASAIVSATPADVLPPLLPANFSLTKFPSTHTIRLQWSANNDDTVRYEVWRRDGDLGNFVLIANVTPPLSAYSDIGLVEELNYTYEVRAIDDVGLASPFTAPLVERLPDVTPPSTPQNFNAAADAAGTSATLSWDLNPTDTVAYAVLRSNSGLAGSFVEVAQTPSSPFTTGGLTRNQTYYFQVEAVDQVLLRSPPTAALSVRMVDTQAPDAPVLISVGPLPSGNTVQLNWTATGDDLGGFRLYTNASGSWAMVGQISGQARTGAVSNLTDGVTAYFRITAIDFGALEGLPSNVLTAVPQDTQRPGPATGLTVSAPAAGAALSLVWSPPTDNDVVGYRILFLDPSVGADYHLAGTVMGTTTFLHTGLTNGATYRYQVVAFDEVPNDGAPSVAASGSPRDTIPPSAPRITTLSTTTNVVNFPVAGTSEPLMNIEIWVRGTRQSTVTADATGNWSGQAKLIAGENEVAARAVDPSTIIDNAAKFSQNSATVHIGLDTVKPTASSSSPPAGATGVDTAAAVVITFSEAVDPASVHIVLRDGSGNDVTGEVTVDVANHTARFTPAAPLQPGATYEASVSGSDTAGNAMVPTSVSFTTKAEGGASTGKGFLPGFDGFLALSALLGAASLALAGRSRRRDS